MLRSLRQTTGSWVVKGFLGIVMLSFAVWGVGDILRGGGGQAVAVVGDVSIGAQEFSNAYQREYQRLSNRFGGRLSREDARNLGLIDATLDRLVAQSAIQQAAADLGLTASDAVIAADIRANPAFRNAVGRFDQAIFEQVLANNGFSEASFVAATRRDVARDQLLRALTANARAPDVLLDRLVGYRGERRIAQLLVVPIDSTAALAEPDDAALREFHRQHETDYTAPELRAVTYFTLQPEDVVAEVVVTDDEIAEEYDIRRDEFATPERREVEQLLYEDETQAQDAYERLARGDDFAAVARETNSLAADAVSLGLITESGLPGEAREAVFALAPEQVSRPIASGFGWHVFRVVRVEPGSTRSLPEVSEELRDDIALDRAADALFDIANRIEDEFAGGASVVEAANRMNIATRRLAAVDAAGRDADGAEIATLPEIGGFLPAVFETEVGAEPALEESEGGSYFALSVEEVVPPTIRPFHSVRTAVRADWEAAARAEATRGIADAIADEIRSGAAIEGLVGREGARFKTTGPLTRGRPGADEDVSIELLTRLFAIAPGEVAVAATPARDGFVVARLAEIRAVDDESGAELRRAVDSAMRASVAGDLLAAYRTALVDTYGVDVNQAAIDALF